MHVSTCDKALNAKYFHGYITKTIIFIILKMLSLENENIYI